MTKTLHILITLGLTISMIAAPSSLKAEDMQYQQIEQEQSLIKIIFNESTIRVKNAEGMTLELFSVTGEKVYEQKVDSQSKSFDISHLQKGYYIVKVGKITRKIYVK